MRPSAIRLLASGSVCVLFLLATAEPARSAPGAEDPPPLATQVVVRGKKVLAEAIQAALPADTTTGASGRPVLVVVDVTPNTAKARGKIEDAFAALDASLRGVPAWSIAALGAKPAGPFPRASGMSARLGKVFGEETDVPSTTTALSKTVKGWHADGGVVLYLADWRFEDDVDLEDFIEDLSKKGRTLSVVGTEAAFGRAWNDGFREGSESITDDIRGFSVQDYWDGVGRDPFGGHDAKAPWHGGDTAYPDAAYRWGDLLWSTAFSDSDWEIARLEDDTKDVRDSTERILALTKEMVEVRVKLAAATPDSAEARELQKRLDALQKEMDDLLASMGVPGAPAPGNDGLEELRKKRDAVSDRLGALLEELFAAGDPKRIEELEAERKRLQAELEDLGRKIQSLESGAPAKPEDLRRRLPGASGEPPPEEPSVVDPEERDRKYALPSSYGSYGLMRAAGVTGGRYVLWSWNPSGRKHVVYEYSRCNLFPPDLRSRKEILADLPKNPTAKALLDAWWTIVKARTEVLEQTPPLKENLRTPAVMVRPDSAQYLNDLWENPSEQRQFVRNAQRSIAALDEAIHELDRGLSEAGEPKTPVDQRYQADALLFRHATKCVRFCLAEAVHAAGLVDRGAWRDRQDHGVGELPWVGKGRDPEGVHPLDDPAAFDPGAGAPLIQERKELLARFRGTPFGEELAMNEIQTARPTHWEHADKVPGTDRSPSESKDNPKPTPKPPGGGSGGGGPATK